MNYLLTGAEFNNKGSEAMTLVALKNIYENDSEASVFLLDYGFYPIFELKKRITYIYVPVWLCEVLLGKQSANYLKTTLKDAIKFFVPGKKSAFRTKSILKNIDVVIDISGFAFSSKWGDSGALRWLDRLELMKNYGAKVWLMPQSFGPFDFSSKNVIVYGKSVLEKCEHIYCREASGYELLRNLGLENVSLMSDSVLIEKDFNPASIIKDYDASGAPIDCTGGGITLL